MCIMDLSYQANQQQSADPPGGGSMHTKTLSLTRLLLLCGAIAGPLFIFTVLIQDYTRPGFDPRLDPLSLLSLGDWGWVQMVNFALAGVLNLLYAVRSEEHTSELQSRQYLVCRLLLEKK